MHQILFHLILLFTAGPVIEPRDAVNFNTLWIGPDTLYANENCKAYLYWTNPTPENSLLVTSTIGGPVTVTLASITAPYQLRDSVPAGVRIRLRYTFSDQNGNTGFRNINIPVVDTIPPKFDPVSSPRQITVDCIYELDVPTVRATDNCTDSLDYSFTEGSRPAACAGGTFDRIWTATDEFGNSATLTQTITVRPDTIAPVFTQLPRDTVLPCGGPYGLIFLEWLDRETARVSASDQGCGLATLSYNAPDTSELVSACGQQEVIFTAVDSCGNESMHTAYFEIQDIFAPMVSRLARDTVVNCASATARQALQDWIDRNGGARASDNCGPLSWSTIPEEPGLDALCDDTLRVVFIARDGCGNQSSTSARFIFMDRTPPFFNISPQDQAVRCDTAMNVVGIFADWLNSGASADAGDHCSEVQFFAAAPGSYMLDDTSSWPGLRPDIESMVCATPEDPMGSYNEVDFVFYDGCGNAVVQTRRFTLLDSVPPIITDCPEDITAFADPVTCEAVIPLTPPDATDNCFSMSNAVSTLWTERITSSVPGNSEVPVDTVVIRIPVNFPFNPGTLGNVSIDLDFFNLDANEPGEFFRVLDEDMNLLGTTSIQSVECVNFSETFDQIPGESLERWLNDRVLTLTLIPNIPQGMSTRFAINDKCGGSSVNARLNFEAGLPGTVLLDYRLNQGDLVPITGNNPGNVRLGIGIHELVYRVYDCQGNADSCVVNIAVFDRTPPSITCPPDATLSLDEGVCTVSRSVPLPFGIADNCTGIEKLEILIVGATNIGPREFNRPYNPQVFPFTKGESTIIYTIRDSAGNQGSCTFKWTILDNEAPEARCESIAISLDPSGLNEYILTPEEIDGGSTDNCDPVQLELSRTRFDCSQAGEEIPVVLRVSDASGNLDSCTAIVRVLVPVLMPSYTVDICGNDTLKLFANTPQGPGSDPFTYQWTGPGGFTSNLRNPIRPGANAAFSGMYRVVATGFNGCVSEGTVQVSISNFNTPTLRSDKTRYCSNEEVLLEATTYAGMVEYEWYEGVPPNGVLIGRTSSPNLLIRPTTGRHRYYVIVKGMNCTTNPSPVYQIDVDAALIAEVEESFIGVCEGERIVLGSPTIGANLTYRWTGPNGFTSDSQYPPAIEPADPNRHSGNYMLIISNGTCSSDPVMVEVKVTPKPPRPRIELNRIACEGDTLTLFVPNITQGDRYIWTKPDGSQTLQLNDNTLLISALRSNEGSWRVRVIIDGCESDLSEPFDLQIEEKLNFIAINDGPVCEGDSVNLSAELVPGATYQWTGPGNFRSTQRQVRTRAFSGVYTVELTTPNGCISTADTRVELRLVPRITALSSSGDSTCVTGVECISLTPTVFPADIGQYTYEWVGPNGFTASGPNPCIPNATEAINGVYRLTVSNGQCRSMTVTTNVRVFNVPPKPQLEGNTVYCVGDTLFLTARVNNTAPGWRYRWKTPGRNYLTSDPTLKIDAVQSGNSGFYSLIIENGPCASASSDSIRISISAQPDRPVVLPLPEVCEGDSIRLEAVSNETYTYFWFGPGSFRTSEKSPVIFPVTPANAGNYSLRVEAGSCRSQLSLPVRLVVHERPDQARLLQVPDRICIDDPEVSLEICAESTSTTDTATYRAVSVPSGQILAELFADCAEIPVDRLSPGINRIAVIGDNRGCLSDTSEWIEIEADQYPGEAAFAGDDLAICDSLLFLTAAIPAQASGMWSSNDGDLVFSDAEDPGTEVTGLKTGNNEIYWTLSFLSCTNFSSDTITIFRDTGPFLRDDDYLIDPASDAILEVLLNDELPLRYDTSIVQGPFHGTARWTQNGTILYRPDGTLTGSDSLQYRICPVGCPDLCDEAWVILRTGEDRECIIPTIITPNGDDYNDVLVIPCLSQGSYPNNSLSIFNIWGDEVFSASPYLNDWDGTYKGNALPEGSYYYVFDAGDNSIQSAGFIIIKR